MPVVVRYPKTTLTLSRAAPAGATSFPGMILDEELNNELNTDPAVGVGVVRELIGYESVRTTMDLKQGYTTSEISMIPNPDNPVDVSYFDFMTWQCGAEVWGAPSTVFMRGAGYILAVDNAFFPVDGKLRIRGPLGLAAFIKNNDDTDLTETLRGTDLSGMTARDMIMYVLDYCGLHNRYNPEEFDGNGQILGYANWEGFVWRYGQTALSFIQTLDAIDYGMDAQGVYGFHITTETADARVQRRLITVNPQLSDPVITLHEDHDLFGSSSISHDVEGVQNSGHVTGYNFGIPSEWPYEPDRFTQFSPYLAWPIPVGPEGWPIVTYDESNDLLEKDDEASPEDGLSCEGYCRALMSQRNCEIVTVTFSTPRDWMANPGQVIYVDCLKRWGHSQTMILEAVTIEWDKGTFTCSGRAIVRN